MIVAFLILAWFVVFCFYVDWDIREECSFQVGAGGSAPRRTLVTAASGDPAGPTRADTLGPYDWDAA